MVTNNVMVKTTVQMMMAERQRSQKSVRETAHCIPCTIMMAILCIIMIESSLLAMLQLIGGGRGGRDTSSLMRRYFLRR